MTDIFYYHNYLLICLEMLEICFIDKFDTFETINRKKNILKNKNSL